MMNAWIDGELSMDERTVFEYHLNNCRTCSEQAEDLCDLTSLLDTRPPDLPSAGLKQKTLSLFIKETGSRGISYGWPGCSWEMQTAMTASVLIGLGIGYKLGTGWAYTQLLDQYGISVFLFSAGGLLSSWV